MRSLGVLIVCHCLATTSLLVVATNRAQGDALVVTKAMQASTIVEVFIDARGIRAEIEIGPADVAAFMNIYSDEFYEKLTGEVWPLQERQPKFFESDWVIQANNQTLLGTPTRLVLDKRVVRDEITGDPLSNQPADAEVVIRLTLRYEFDDQPRTITFHPLLTGDNLTANIGFLCYHEGLPVNDFRYLSGEVTLDLDWDDPWYSRFRHANFRRQFDAPLSAFLYIEPYEIRKEIIVRPKDLEAWLDLGLDGDGVITVEEQKALNQQVAEFLQERNVVTIDGQPALGRLDRVHFIHRSLRTTGIIEPAVDLDATSATLGVIFVYPVDSLPEQVTMRWDLFTPRIQKVPAVASDEAGGLPSTVTPDDPVLVWRNYLTNPTSTQMLIVGRPPARRQFVIPILSVFAVGVAVGSLVVLIKQHNSNKTIFRTTAAFAIAALAVGVVSLPFAQITIANPFDTSSALSATEGKDVLTSLLHNVYRSFDYHDEGLIYDRLARSISGDLLSDVYLETRENMEVKNQGGLRISVKDVKVTEIDLVDSQGENHTFRCRWQVSGWIGHWGHIHARVNEYLALITIAERDGDWKITAMEMLDEQSQVPSQTPSQTQRGSGA